MPSISAKNSPFLTPVIWTNPASTGSKWATAFNRFATLAEFFVSHSEKTIKITSVPQKGRTYPAKSVYRIPLDVELVGEPAQFAIRLAAASLKGITAILALRALATLATHLQGQKTNFFIKACALPKSGISAWLTGASVLMIAALTLTKIYVRCFRTLEFPESAPSSRTRSGSAESGGTDVQVEVALNPDQPLAAEGNEDPVKKIDEAGEKFMAVSSTTSPTTADRAIVNPVFLKEEEAD